MKKMLTAAPLMALMTLGVSSAWAQNAPNNPINVTVCSAWLVFPSAGKSKDQIAADQCGSGQVDIAKQNGFPTSNPDRPAWISSCKSLVSNAISGCTEGSETFATCVRTGLSGAGAQIPTLNKQYKQTC